MFHSKSLLKGFPWKILISQSDTFYKTSFKWGPMVKKFWKCWLKERKTGFFPWDFFHSFKCVTMSYKSLRNEFYMSIFPKITDHKFLKSLLFSFRIGRVPRAPRFGNMGLAEFKTVVSLKESGSGLVPSHKIITYRELLLHLCVN